MPPLEKKSNNNGQSADYYAAGNSELATETKLTLSRLEPVSTVDVTLAHELIRFLPNIGVARGSRIDDWSLN